MAQITVKFATPAIVQDGDNLTVNFDDGTNYTVSGVTGMQDRVEENRVTIQQLHWIAVANRMAADPQLDSPQLWDGKTVTFNEEAANPAQAFTVT